jgi:hypothetical protein
VPAPPAPGAPSVKVQYPNAERVMRADLVNLRALGTYLKQFEVRGHGDAWGGWGMDVGDVRPFAVLVGSSSSTWCP